LAGDRSLVERWTRRLIAEITVDPDEIRTYYDTHKRDFLKPARVKVSQILLPTEDRAIQALDMVKEATETRFREVARQMSIGVEADKGGEMGVFELGQLPSDMESVIFALKEGEVSRVMQSAYGYHIFRVDMKFSPELVEEEEAAVEIEPLLRDLKRQEFLSAHIEGLKSRLSWTQNMENLSFVYQGNDHE
jgi:parvulin-like peptidyl-prolyl isomerase